MTLLVSRPKRCARRRLGGASPCCSFRLQLPNPGILELERQPLLGLIERYDPEGIRGAFVSRRPNRSIRILGTEPDDGIPLINSRCSRTVQGCPATPFSPNQRLVVLQIEESQFQQGPVIPAKSGLGMGGPCQKQCHSILLLRSGKHNNNQIIETPLTTQLSKLRPIAVRLRTNLICRNDLFDRDGKRSTDILAQRFAKTKHRLVRKVWCRAWIGR